MLVTTAEDGGQQAGNPGGDQQQQTVAGWLFQGFQQGIGGGLRHPFGIRNDHHLATTQLGGALQAAADLADGLDPYAPAVGTYGAEIRVMTLVQQLAGVAVTAGFTAIRLLAEVQARQSFCKLLLAKAGIPEQQPGVAQPTGLGLALQGVGLSSGMNDAFAVHEYLDSRDSLKILQARYNLKAMLTRPNIDWFSRTPRPWEGTSDEALYKGFKRLLTVGYDAASPPANGTTQSRPSRPP